MKRVRVRVHLPSVARASVHEAVVDRDGVEAAHLLYGGVHEEDPAYVYYVRADREALVEGLEAAGADDYELRTVEDRQHHLYLREQPGELERQLQAAFTRASLVATLPVVYHDDGSATTSVVGDVADLRAAVEDAPVDVTIEAVADYGAPAAADGGPSLTDRQREVLAAAREAGYYDVPRGATQAEVAETVGLATGTVAEHLRKAEAALVDDALDGR